jgi:hypothetical protein
MTPEGKVKRKINALLKSYGPKIYYDMPVPGGYGKRALDYIGCVDGKYFSIEAKKPGGKPTEIQHQTIKSMREAGAIVFVVSNDEELAQLEYFLNAHT